jgi:peptidoglycan/LPS O-acetylase OafA/YrhL
MAAPPGRRIAALDGLRGLMAAVVAVHHYRQVHGELGLVYAADAAVFVFFVLSGLVLTRAWDGRFLVFLLRRFLRLWPVYGVCLLAGHVLLPDLGFRWSQFLWWPAISALDSGFVDPPMWSLCVEARAMLVMPAIVWCASGSPWRMAVGCVVVLGIEQIDTSGAFLLFFLLGAWLGRHWEALPALKRAAALLTLAPMQFLGLISYSLYLSHWIVLLVLQRYLGDPGAIVSLAAVLAVGTALFYLVEQPAIAFSRRIAGGARVRVERPTLPAEPVGR